jgi:hypothetical protein
MRSAGRSSALVLLVLVALLAPGTAKAHLRTGRVAVDYRASVSPLRPPLAGAVDVRVFRPDLALRVRALGGHRVVVLGYFDEPFLRIGPGGVFVNDASLTAAGAGLATAGTPSGHTARWRLRSHTPSVTWHDVRLRLTHVIGTTEARHGRWAVPLVVDGRRSKIGGEITRARTPSAWPWIVLGALFAVAVAVLLARRSIELVRSAAALLGWIAAIATLTAAIGFAASSTASEGIWVEAANEILLALVGMGFLLRGSRDARALAGGLLGLLALAVGLTKLPVLTHGIVLSALPGQLARLAVVVAISAGAAAAILGVVVFFHLLEHYEEPEALRRYL